MLCFETTVCFSVLVYFSAILLSVLHANVGWLMAVFCGMFS